MALVSATSVENNATATAGAGSNRVLEIIPHVGNTGAAATITSVTFGGVAAVEATQYSESGSEWGLTGIYYILEANIPSGAQTVAVTASAGTIDEVSILTRSDIDQTDPIREVITPVEASSTSSVVASFTSGVAGDDGTLAGHGARVEMFATLSNSWTESLRHAVGTTRMHIVATKTLEGGATLDDCTATKGGVVGRASFVGVAWRPAGGSPVAYSLQADAGSYSLTGQAATLIAGGGLSAEQGTYSLLGSDGLVDIEIDAVQGSYTLTGQVADLEYPKRIAAEQGSYALTGQNAGLSYSGAVIAAVEYIVRNVRRVMRRGWPRFGRF